MKANRLTQVYLLQSHSEKEWFQLFFCHQACNFPSLLPFTCHLKILSLKHQSGLYCRHNPGRKKVCKLHCLETQIRSMSETYAKSHVLVSCCVIHLLYLFIFLQHFCTDKAKVQLQLYWPTSALVPGEPGELLLQNACQHDLHTFQESVLHSYIHEVSCREGWSLDILLNTCLLSSQLHQVRAQRILAAH